MVKRWQIFWGSRDLEDDVDDDVEAGGDDEGDGEDGLVAPPHLEDQGDQKDHLAGQLTGSSRRTGKDFLVFSTVEGGEAGGSILSPSLLSVSLKMSGLDLETKKNRISSPQKLQKLDHLAILGHS